MAKKTANIMVRIEPEIKEAAEAVLSDLGVPISVVINMLYKQIIKTGGIPFEIVQRKDTPPVEQAEVKEEEASSVTFEDTYPDIVLPKGAKKIVTVVNR